MNSRLGFTLLEATIAMSIVGLVAVVALGEFSTELRVGVKAAEARLLQALAQDRVSALQVAPPEILYRVPDSLKTGAFPAPFDEYSWNVSIQPVRAVEGLAEARITVASKSSELTLTTRLFRPMPRTKQRRP